VIDITPARTPDDVAAVKTLLRGMAAHFRVHGWPGVADDEFDAEVEGPQAQFAEPAGRLLLARIDGEAVGCLGLRPLADGTVELRRMFVAPEARRSGVARALVLRMINEARDAGHDAVRLVTVPAFAEAITLYESLGFVQVAPFRPSTAEDAVFMERRIR
jgi:GNAT superfamily N-acetyltransferase